MPPSERTPVVPGREPEQPVRKVELVISYTLRIGVITSIIVIALGSAISFIHHPDYLSSADQLKRLTEPGAAFPHTLGELALGLRSLRGRAIVGIGLMLLIATPVARVAISIVAFAYQRDRTFVLITSTVLVLLLLSFVLGHTS
jgi:uncharacterized membrane protein